MFFVKEISDVHFIDAYIINRSAEKRSTTGSRNFSGLSCRLSGSSTFYVGETETTVSCPDSVYNPQNLSNDRESTDEVVAAIRFYTESCKDTDIMVLPAEIGRDTETMTKICTICMKGSVASRFNAAAMFYEMLARFAGYYSEIKDYRVKLATEYMTQNLKNPDLDIEEVASALGISSVFLRKLFRENSEDTPVHTLNTLRMNEAKRLLVQTEMAVGEIAFLCGFREAKYFSSVFRESFGMTAGNYRKMHR